MALRPALQVGADYASGDSGGATYRAFDPLLPDVHHWQGAMDLFAWSNEEEANARVSIVPATDALVRLEYRYVRLAQAGAAWRTAYLTTVGSAPGNTNANLGNEIDAMFRWSPWDPLDLELGYSVFLLGEGARVILAANALGISRPGNPPVSTETVSQFGYAQATLRLP